MSDSGASERTSATDRRSDASSAVDNASQASSLEKLQAGETDSLDISDLIQQQRTVQDAVYATLYTLTKSRFQGSWRWTFVVIAFQILQIFLMMFNPAHVEEWALDGGSWFFRGTEWILYSGIVGEKSYDTYVTVMYVLGGLVLFCLGVTAWVAVALKKDDSSGGWMQRLIVAQQWVAFLLFDLFWIAHVDYLSFMFNCSWATISTGVTHLAYTDKNCLAFPHVLHMLFAGFLTTLIIAATFCMTVGSCNPNLLSKDHQATAMPTVQLKIVVAKVVIVLAPNIAGYMEFESVAMLLCCVYITWLLLTELPYQNYWMNYLWCGLWTGMVYTAVLLVALVYVGGDLSGEELEAAHYRITWAVPYGIVPVALFGAALAALSGHWNKRVLKVVDAAYQSGVVDLRTVYRFTSIEQVLFLATAMRKWDQDGVPDPEAGAFGLFILKCGLARFPTDPYLMVVLAILLMEVHKDAPTARLQLQAAAKNKPNLINSYFTFAGNELLKRLKSSSDGMDLMGYVEFQRNYLACVRMHKLALSAQRRFWRTLLTDTVRFSEVQTALQQMDAMEKQATNVYKRVLERYPGNGKLLKVYGRFLEYVRNDPWSANHYYGEATKAGTGESMMELMKGQSSAVAGVMGQVDENKDAMIIINASGTMIVINNAAHQLLGYGKGELEGKNVSCLMPQPFSGQHSTYLQRYLTTNEAHILDSKRQVVALRKDRMLLPVDIAVTKLSGTGPESIFLGVMRPTADEDHAMVRVWSTPQGIILCADSRFRDWFGVSGEALVGRPCHSLGKNPEAIAMLLHEAQTALEDKQDLSSCSRKTAMLHAFLPPVDVNITLQQGGTDDHPIFVLNIRCMVNDSQLLVTTPQGAIVYVTSSLACLLGYSASALTSMHLRNLMPAPWADLHTGWLKRGAAAAGQAPCLNDRVVDLVASNGAKLPVTLKCSSHAVGDQVTQVFEVVRCPEEARLDQKRLLLSVTAEGIITSVDSALTPRTLFGFPPQQLQGQRLSSCVQQAAEWVQGGHGTDMDLLLLLMEKCGAEGGTSWTRSCRVGVSAPPADPAGQEQQAAARTEATATLAAALARMNNKVRPSVLRVRWLAEHQEDLLQLVESGQPVLQVELWRAEELGAAVEMDGQQCITRADEAFCLMTGHTMGDVLQQPLSRLLRLPPAADLETSLGLPAKKSLIKAGVAQVTQLQPFTGTHKDGEPLQLTGQLVKGAGKALQPLLRLHLVAPSPGSLQPMLAMRRSQAAATQQFPQPQVPFQEAGAQRDSSDAGQGGLQGAGGSDAEGWEPYMLPEGHEREHRPSGSLDLHHQLQSRLRVGRWLQDHPESIGNGSSDGGLDTQQEQDDGHAIVQVHSSWSPGKSQIPKSTRVFEEAPVMEAEAGQADEDALSAIESAAGEGEQDKELVADFRRAKRLKKLRKLLLSSAAQSSTLRFRQHTLFALLGCIAVHICCFVALSLCVSDRFQDANTVSIMGTATDRFLRIFVRNKVLQRCKEHGMSQFEFCDESRLARYLTLMHSELSDARGAHQGLLLGFDNLKTFADPRLLEYWIHSQLPEASYQSRTVDGPDVYTNSTASLWEIGNRLFSYAYDVCHLWPTLGAGLNTSEAWQYVELNSQGSMFSGYAWTLDTFVDYTWSGLQQLGTVLMVLLVLEAAVLQPACIFFAFYLLARCQRQRMKRFSSFLGVPSAALKVMATRTIQVDEDIASEADDEEQMEMVAVTRAGDDQAPAKAESSKKSVRMAKDIPSSDEDQDLPDSSRRRRASKERRRSSRTQHTSAAAAAPATACGQLIKRFQDRVISPLSSTVKVNGHKLYGNNKVFGIFLVPLLLWLVAVVALFGNALMQIETLQEPLMSMDAAAHVLYRLARARAYANLYALASSPAEISGYRGLLSAETEKLASVYRTLLYGGAVDMVAPVSISPNIPPAAFYSREMATQFFTTSGCLRADPSGCFTPDSPYHAITHQGLDAMIIRFIDNMRRFAAAPDAEVNPNNTNFEYIYYVVGYDLNDGLQHAIKMFGEHAIEDIGLIKQEHLILFIASVLGAAAYILLVYRPYVNQLHQETKLAAGLLSQLPPEVDVEGQVKLAVLGATQLVPPGGKPGLGSASGLLPVVSGPPGGLPPPAWPAPAAGPMGYSPRGSVQGALVPYPGPPPWGAPPSGAQRFSSVYPRGSVG